MKKFGLVFLMIATLVAVLVTTGHAHAQTGPTPTQPAQGSGYGYGNGYGRGMGMMGNGMMGYRVAGRGAGLANGGEGILHDTMISVFAQKLGLTVDELNTRLANGETMAQIAASKGLTAEQFTALMTDARTQAIDQAVKDGKLTQAQADWMKQRGAAAYGGMMGAGRGRGMGWNGAGNPAACPFFSQANQ